MFISLNTYYSVTYDCVIIYEEMLQFKEGNNYCYFSTLEFKLMIYNFQFGLFSMKETRKLHNCVLMDGMDILHVMLTDKFP